jgi:hypothetical protein
MIGEAEDDEYDQPDAENSKADNRDALEDADEKPHGGDRIASRPAVVGAQGVIHALFTVFCIIFLRNPLFPDRNLRYASPSILKG